MGEGLQLQPCWFALHRALWAEKVLHHRKYTACRGADVLRDIRHIKQPVWWQFRRKAKAY